MALATPPDTGAASGHARGDSELVADLVAGRSDALAEIYDRYHRAVHAVAMRVTADRTHAEDVVQEVFVALWKQPAAYRSERGSLGTWLMATSHHKSVDLVRREESLRRRRDQVAVEAEQTLREEEFSEPVDDAAAERWQAQRVREALAKLPEAQRQALVLAYFGGFTQREVASVTGVPLGTVKTRMLAAMRRLRESLAPLSGLDGFGPGANDMSGLKGGAT